MRKDRDIQNEPLQDQNTERVGQTAHLPKAGWTQHSGLFRLSTLCLGVMCILQATLNITLRLHFNSQDGADQLQREPDSLFQRLSQLQNTKQEEWSHFNSSIYILFTMKKSWSESRQYCRDRGTDLVIIVQVSSREEQEFLSKKAGSHQAWIGLADIHKEGRLKWVDGSAPSTEFWDGEEPNGYPGDCVVIGNRPDHHRNWADYSCNHSFTWICERPLE